MNSRSPVFDSILRAIQKTGDMALLFQYQNDLMLDQFRESKEREQLVEEITEKVLSRISLTVDASEIFAAFDEIDKRLKNLGQ